MSNPFWYGSQDEGVYLTPTHTCAVVNKLDSKITHGKLTHMEVMKLLCEDCKKKVRAARNKYQKKYRRSKKSKPTKEVR